MRAIVIEDDQDINQQIVSRLKQEGFAVDSADNGVDGLYLMQEFPCDVAIVDLGLPEMSGMDVIKKIRADGSDLPILILTARGRWQDKVEGLDAGADDYLVKPFHQEELMARIRVLIRRAAGWSDSTLQCGPVVLDPSTQRVTLSEQEIELTAYEYKVIEYLMVHAGEVVSKSVLTEHLYDDEGDRDSNVIEVFIRRLRQKLDPDDSLQPIETLRGRGYRFTLEPAKVN
ncbi:MAG: response regulator transcription factor [Gammaproteobacteria bacterium]|jgi:two-component system response regulator PhoP|nr:response regulator transcription factor [Gammaproteobacteria bacterium]MBT3722432.1 response regulator transcription factor [Gammaproteobacteria bacterium]MBT4078305.1 response regulator transcription factor [Gammaproteobacteria bacterium]MBT4196555.1 response regulator transcription factor [Gammaproteobacteria bacterium]MBT4450241.1 response regulator transcription factor [Gammaproteobacteria bacterium]